ncbi:MAG: hypothetical protein IT384_02825 [Deltaproteobacteria bacterium]|nr:hypothetical protein [Deltaproteobacteria bacterium]
MTLRITLFSLVLGAALLGGCKGGGAAMTSDPGEAAKAQACETSCDEAKQQCVDKCAQEVDKDACNAACTAAREKCSSDCKGS